uniref:Calmodulin-binding domain-containing protein n=1 Tax=Rhizophora mucronata TaxID=61149 RepID=A0A2P2N032_RHIMU
MLEKNQSLKGNARMRFRSTTADGNTNDSEPDSEKVVLRHQDVRQKKDAQGLFNNIIEETASRLVETRKSKVKALVGPFETVIFIQDGKSSPNTASGLG